MQKRLRIIWLSAALGISFGSAANDAEYRQSLSAINKLLKEKDFIAAFEMADQLTYEFGGEPEFDLLTGFAAYGSENYQEAVFAFERVLISKPGSFSARFYLALSYQKVDNLHAAIIELEKLLDRPITQSQRDKTSALLKRVNRTLTDRKISWYQMVAGSIAFDDNVNTGTSAESITLPSGDEFLLSDDSRAAKDISYGLNYYAGYQHAINQSQWFKFDFSANHHGYADRSQYNRQQLGLTFSYEQELLRGQISVAGYTRPLWLEQEIDVVAEGDSDSPTVTSASEVGLYRTENGASLYFQKNTSRKTSYRLGGSYSMILNELNPELDFSRIKASGAFQYKTKLLHTILGHYTQDDADNSDFDHNSKITYGATYQLTWPISNTLVSNSHIMVEQHQYDSLHPFFGVKRDETFTMLSSQLLFNSSDKLQLKLQVNYQKKDSNIDLFGYDRLEVVGSWQYRF